MRLGLDGREYQSPGATGIGRRLTDLIEWIAANRPDVTPVIFLNQRCHYEPPSPCVETVTITEGFTPIWDQVLLPRALRRSRIDVFLSPYMKMPMVTHCPVVMEVHDLIPIRMPAYSSGSGVAKNVYFRMATTAAVRRAARIITVSDFTRREIVKVFGVKKDRISVVPNGIREGLRPECDPGKQDKAMQAYGLSGQYILYIGQLRASKNVESLVRAYATLPVELRNRYTLAIGGRKTDEYPRLKKVEESLGLNDRVRFLGHVDDAHFMPLISRATLFVYPSRYEGFGFPPLEAMACGAPVVCSTATSLEEIVGDAAIGVNPPDAEPLAAAIKRVLEDGALRESLARKGPLQAQKFSVDRMAMGILNVIEAL